VAEESEFKVGDEWLFVPSDTRNEPRWIKITSVGRKWVSFTTTQTRVDRTNTGESRYRMIDKENSSPGRVFRTEEDYLEEKGLNDRRRTFYQQVSSFSFCMKLTNRQITEAANVLGIALHLPNQ
jgi:hypothetical protein